MPLRIASLLSATLLATGCAQDLRPIFSQDPQITWPPPPTTPRIRYVGQLRSAADLKPPAKPFQALGNLLVGPEKPKLLYGPRSLVRVRDGERLWVADPGGRCLHLFDLSRRSYLKVDRLGDSPLLCPVGLCLGPEGSIYVCDSESIAIHRLSDKTGLLLESLRLSPDIHRPVAVAYDARTDELYVVDIAAHDIKVLKRDGRVARTIGRRGSRLGEFNFPCDLTLDGDLLWVADTGNHRVQALTCAGEPVVDFGQAGDAPGDLALPKGVAVDSDGHVYVVDARFENIQIFDRSGTLLLIVGQEGNGPGEFWLPAGIFIDPHDRIWVCDSYNRRVQVLDYLKLPPATDPKPANPAEPVSRPPEQSP